MNAAVIKAGVEMITRPWIASCAETHDRLSDHLEGELTGRDAKRVLRHLVRCDRCRAMLESLSRTLDHLRSLGVADNPSPASGATSSAVVERIRREQR